MKVNIVLTILSVAISALLGYAVYSVAGIDPNASLSGICSIVCFMGTLVPAFGLKYKTRALSVNLRALSLVAFVVMLICHFSFASIWIKMPYYLIVSGLILCVYIGIAYVINSTKQY